MLDYQDYILPNILETSVLQEAIDFFTTRQMIDLPLTEPFSDAGVYALYYFGNFENYCPIANINKKTKSLKEYFPIYVGKAVPKGSRTARTKTLFKQTLFKRIKEHTKSIQSASNLDLKDFKCRFAILRGNEVDLINPLESALIRQYAPLWNSCVSGFGIHHPGSGRYGQKKSEWDTLHMGRYFADKLTGKKLNLNEIKDKITQYTKNL
ncbi:MAG: Eco29kI family restriction endonuclease [Methanoregula sp.]|nr:Eco29kI family restriction endonuclease [Methanoregula sp.]